RRGNGARGPGDGRELERRGHAAGHGAGAPAGRRGVLPLPAPRRHDGGREEPGRPRGRTGRLRDAVHRPSRRGPGGDRPVPALGPHGLAPALHRTPRAGEILRAARSSILRRTMAEKMSRRAFVKAGTAAGGLAKAAPKAFGQAPTVMTPKSVSPVVVSSANGNKYKNGGPRTAVEEAFTRIVKGEDVLDALIAGVNIVELDPEDDSVGYGGLPNAEGVVQLDASCMHGPRRRAGAVAAIEGVRTPSLVAKAVMDTTDHHLIVGKGAQDFARSMGFNIEADLNTPNSRAKWLEWKRRIDPTHYLDPAKREEASRKVTRDMMREGLIDPGHVYGTINCDGVNGK